MIAELGNVALIVALMVALVQSTLPFLGIMTDNTQLMRVAKASALTQGVLLMIATGLLAYSFLVSDFSVLNVANHSNTLLPWYYKVAATWGSHEGSILFWTLTLGLWTMGVALFSARLPRVLVARVIGILGWISVGLLLFMIFTSNPFDRLFPIPTEGADLNPLLQDPGMIFHPPLLYMGYVGFAVPFAFAIAALMSGQLDVAWARWMRPWTTFAWIFLTLGNALGSYWSYYELGWGGWWFWDPVENSSFMPWLTGTALMHSLAVAEKRGSFKIWTVFLAILTFSLSLLGTFLVRSGILTSVHAFATDPERGLFILAFLIIVVGLSFLLFAWRAPMVKTIGDFSMISRESLLLVNNVLLVVAMGAVLLGTLYPLFIDALNAGKISVGPPYFEAVFGPLMLPLVFLVAIGPLLKWKEGGIEKHYKKLAFCLGLSLAHGIGFTLAMGAWSHWIFISLTLAFFILCGIVEAIIHDARYAASWWEGFKRIARSIWGMHLAHLGIAVFVVGVALVKGYALERDLKMTPGDTVTLANYTYAFDKVTSVQGPNYSAQRGHFTLKKDGEIVTELYPEKRVYQSMSQMPMTEAAIAHFVTGDAYVSLGNAVGAEAWTVRLYWKPFITWIWWGALLMALGGLLAASDRRYYPSKKQSSKKNTL